jgi:hypothetical protein
MEGAFTHTWSKWDIKDQIELIREFGWNQLFPSSYRLWHSFLENRFHLLPPDLMESVIPLVDFPKSGNMYGYHIGPNEALAAYAFYNHIETKPHKWDGKLDAHHLEDIKSFYFLPLNIRELPATQAKIFKLVEKTVHQSLAKISESPITRTANLFELEWQLILRTPSAWNGSKYAIQPLPSIYITLSESRSQLKVNVLELARLPLELLLNLSVDPISRVLIYFVEKSDPRLEDFWKLLVVKFPKTNNNAVPDDIEKLRISASYYTSTLAQCAMFGSKPDMSTMSRAIRYNNLNSVTELIKLLPVPTVTKQFNPYIEAIINNNKPMYDLLINHTTDTVVKEHALRLQHW